MTVSLALISSSVRLQCRLHFLAFPEAGVDDLNKPTLEPGEDYAKLLADPTAFEDYDLESARTKGYGFARIQRYAIEHLLGVR